MEQADLFSLQLKYIQQNLQKKTCTSDTKTKSFVTSYIYDYE